MSAFSKYDGWGNEVKPGDVCVRYSNGKLEYIIFKTPVWGGSQSKGEFGKFVTSEGESSLKFKNVLVVNKPKIIQLIRKYYEEK